MTRKASTQGDGWRKFAVWVFATLLILAVILAVAGFYFNRTARPLAAAICFVFAIVSGWFAWLLGERLFEGYDLGL